MSQAGKLNNSLIPPVDAVQALTGTTGGRVGPDGTNNINILGSGVISVAGDAGTNTLTISVAGVGFQWNDITTAGPINLAAENGYIADSVFNVSFILPTNSKFGDTIRIMGKGSGGFTVTYGANQQILYGNSSSSLTVGSLSSTNNNDCVELICSTTSATQPIFTVFSSIGNLSLT